MAKVTKQWIEERKAALPQELLALISAQPGRAKTYYLFLPVERGGLRGLSDDKYAALEQLLGEGKVEWGCNRGKVQQFKGLYPAGHPERDVARLDSQLERELIGLVERDPGRGESHYCRVPLNEGGVKGSQERKERALARLIDSGQLLRVELERPLGRLKRAVFPVGACP